MSAQIADARLDETCLYHIRGAETFMSIIAPVVPWIVLLENYKQQDAAIEWCTDTFGPPIFRQVQADHDVFKANNAGRWDYWSTTFCFKDERDVLMFKLSGFPIKLSGFPIPMPIV